MKLAQLLKSEISRLSKREINAAIAPLKKQIARLRAELAALKREQGETKRAERKAHRENPAPIPDKKFPESTSATPRRFSPTRLKQLRSRKGLSGPEMAKLIGCSPQTIYNWESGNSRPSAKQLDGIAAVRVMGIKAIRETLA